MLTAQRGITAVEMLITIAVVGLLLAMGLPSFGAFLASSKVRHAAEGFQAGLALARSEAMRRNQTVQFVLTDDTVDLGSVGSVTPSSSGRTWLVRALDTDTGNWDLVETRSAYEAGGGTEGAPVILVAANAAQIAFRPLGGTQGLASMASIDLSNPSGGSCHTASPPGPIRCLRLQVSVAGHVRLCDPGTTAPDTRAC